jgi:hypothetical protein
LIKGVGIQQEPQMASSGSNLNTSMASKDPGAEFEEGASFVINRYQKGGSKQTKKYQSSKK